MQTLPASGWTLMLRRYLCCCIGASLFLAISTRAAEDIVLGDFEGDSYAPWKVDGTAFGAKPAHGTLPGQMHVEGFAGRGLANSFAGGDNSLGTLTSPPFRIERRYIHFLIGGGGYSNETCINLLVDGAAARTATGPNVNPGGSEQLSPAAWDVSDLAGREAVIQIVDRRKGGWGHINVDQIVLTDRKPVTESRHVTRDMLIAQRYLHFPVKNGAAKKKVQIRRGAEVLRDFDIELADSAPDWWAFLDVEPWRGETLTVQVDRLRDDSAALRSISQENEIKGAETLYREPLRPQIHFSARRGWLNDPNGLVFHNGAYHLFFQHNPYGWSWGNMHWGHAISTDLLHWRELPEALYPDASGPMFSGSAVVDWKNTSGFGSNGQPPIVLIYTAAGNPTVQCLAYSTDNGQTFTKYARNPVLPQITPGNRDPKVFWHEPTGRWIMALYVGFDETKAGRKETRHSIHFLSSPDLKSWTVTGQVNGFYECPDMFELPVGGDAARRQWVLTAASSEYMVGSFDGRTFTPETAKLQGHRGKGFYAAQTYSDIPAADGRRIQIGWLQAPSPGMPFNQAMTLPLELKLLSTAEGPRLAWQPCKEVDMLTSGTQLLPLATENNQVSWKFNPAVPSRITLDFEPEPNAAIELRLAGVNVTYDATKQELAVNQHRAPAPLRSGKQRIVIFSDRTALEVFASDGLTYVPMPVSFSHPEAGASITVRGRLKAQSFSAATLTSIWGEKTAGGRGTTPPPRLLLDR